MIQKCAVILVVLDEEVRRTTAVDLLAWYEERALQELATKVYKEGYEGLTWPRLERIPFTLRNGQLEVTERGLNVYEWRICAEVEAVPR